MAVVTLGALVYGATVDSGPRTSDDRATEIKSGIQCPVCNGQNVLESNAPVAINIRAEIDRLIDEGRTDEEINAVLAATYGEQVILNPSGEGATALVWVLPLVAVAAGAALLDLAFSRWRSQRMRTPSDEDRALVAAARTAARGEVSV